jgi:hypothetical protein
VRRLLRDRRGERDRGTPDVADRELQLRRRELDDENLVVGPSPVQMEERSRFVARSLKMWQEMCFRVFRDPTRVRHQFGELDQVSGKRLSRSDPTTAFVFIPTPPGHAPIVAQARCTEARDRVLDWMLRAGGGPR